MAGSVSDHLKPRKTPRQQRSVMTVGAITEATIQVLLARGAARLTTTDVAQRAGVSIGTLYQYFPNKEALLHAVLEQHLEMIGAAFAASAQRHRGRTLAEITEGMVADYLDAKIANLDISRALYRMLPDLDAADLQKAMASRIERALVMLMESASDKVLERPEDVVPMVRMLLTGMVRATIEEQGGPSEIARLRSELSAMTLAYLQASSVAA